jgi:ribosomal protein S18 acetylase RimI-like enzyme
MGALGRRASISQAMPLPVNIREASTADWPQIWPIVEPVIRAGDSYVLPQDWPEDQARTYWFQIGNEVFVAEAGGTILGTYFLRASALGPGSHIANCGYMTAPAARGRGIARAMCLHSLAHAKSRGFHAMHFNFVVATNASAIKLWRDLGFTEVGRRPQAFRHPTLGLVDALIMHRLL